MAVFSTTAYLETTKGKRTQRKLGQKTMVEMPRADPRASRAISSRVMTSHIKLCKVGGKYLASASARRAGCFRTGTSTVGRDCRCEFRLADMGILCTESRGLPRSRGGGLLWCPPTDKDRPFKPPAHTATLHQGESVLHCSRSIFIMHHAVHFQTTE